jgi:hypothetical protein
LAGKKIGGAKGGLPVPSKSSNGGHDMTHLEEVETHITSAHHYQQLLSFTILSHQLVFLRFAGLQSFW